MSLIPETQYPGKIEPASAEYPYGKARNITTPGDGTGTPWEAALLNDIFGFQQALLSNAAIVPSGTPDEVGASQYLDALHKAIGQRAYSNISVTVPTDFTTLQEAVDNYATVVFAPGTIVDIIIETGHSPASGIEVIDGDYSHMRISAVDALVALDVTFPATDIIKGTNARMPTLNCLIDANGKGLNGYFADKVSEGQVTIGSGIINCQRQGCYANDASAIMADGGIFTGASQESAAYSGILAWGSRISAAGADASNSLYYGAQAAAGGVLDFRDGIATGAARHGVRATNAGTVNARDAVANNCGVAGFRAFDNGTVHATGSTATGSLTNAYYAQHNSRITCGGAVCDAVGNAIFAGDLSMVSAETFTSTSGAITANEGSVIYIRTPTITNTGGKVAVITNSASIKMEDGSLTGGDGTEIVQVQKNGKFYSDATDLIDTGTSTYLSTVTQGELHISGGAHTAGKGINILSGSIVRLHTSGILAANCPGMSNAVLVARGIMWGAS